jgi:hypothetical protein
LYALDLIQPAIIPLAACVKESQLSFLISL